MEQESFRREHSRTAYVTLDTKKCVACWKCKEVCSSNVIGRINLPWHKHVRIMDGRKCTGCLRCLKVCTSNALQKRTN